MVRLNEIPRTACFAWSPGAGLPLLASGTKAGAVSADFSSETRLELWDLDLGNPTKASEPSPAATINTESRFYDLSWSQPNSTHSKGVIAGGLDNGALHLWDAAALLEGSSESLIATSQKHTAALKALQFSPFNQDLLATGGAKGELYIMDLKNVDSPTRLGNPAASRTDDLDALDFNKCVPYILGTAGTNGFVTVWDLRSKKESLSLNNLNRKPISAIAWDPKTQYRLITAIPDDNYPLVLSWDLRNANAPLKQLQGHEGGVLSLSWCQQDEDLLLSSGKDNRTICWNPQTGEQLGELPAVTNWVFQTRWNPHFPNLLATASFDGRLTVQSIQSSDVAAPAQAQSNDTDDFFGKAQTTPPGSGLTLKKPPRWIERSCGASFGFGGKLVTFATAKATRTSSLKITTFQPDSTVGPNLKSFEKTLSEGDLQSICESHIETARTEQEKADWSVIKTLTQTDIRQSLLNYMGFAPSKDEAADGISALSINGHAEDAKPTGPSAKEQTNGVDKKNSRLSSFFDTQNDGDNFLAELASTKGAKTNEPFSLYTGGESESDRRVTHALVLGEFDKALEICLQENRLSDAFMVAICGGPECIEKAKKAYFNQKSGGPNYLRLLASVVGKNLWDVVYNADLENWSEVAAAVCTFADPEEFPDLCEALGDRLLEDARGDSNQPTVRKNASQCYLAGGKLEKISKIWIEDLAKTEHSKAQDEGADSSFSIHASLLQAFIEKVTIFREAIDYEDEDITAPSGWKLTPLYEKYLEFANIATAHGQMDVAKRYLDLLPAQFPAAQTARTRIQQATGPQAKPANLTGAMRNQGLSKPMQGSGMSSLNRMDNQTPAQYSQYGVGGPAAAVPRGYNPTNVQPSQNQPKSAYRPAQQPIQNAYQPTAQPMQYGAQMYNSLDSGSMNSRFGQPGAMAGPPPPRTINASPSVAPPSKGKNLEAWNDTPFVAKPPTSRRGTPSIPQEVAANPYMFQPSPQMSPGGPSSFVKTAAPAPPPPPPKGSTAPPRTNRGPQPSFQAPPPQASERPPSSQYTPTATEHPAPFSMQPGIPRGQSPYNAPPSVPAATNRYAPVSQPIQQGPVQGSQPPFPGQRSGVPPSHFQPHGGLPPGPPASSTGPPPPSTNRYGAPPQSSQASSVMPPPRAQNAPPPISRPSTAASHTSQGSNSSSAIYPKGDRSHIPPEARPIFEILSAQMERVAAQASPNYAKHVADSQKRLEILYDHLNRQDLLKPDTVAQLVQLARDLEQGRYAEASAMQMGIQTQKAGECGMWMIGVKRLCMMAKNVGTPGGAEGRVI